MVSLEIVEVTMVRCKSGEKSNAPFDDWEISQSDPDDWPECNLFDINGNQLEARPSDGSFFLCELPVDWVGLNFKCVGQSFDDTVSGGVGHEIEQNGSAETFQDYVDEFIEIGNRLLDIEQSRTVFGVEHPRAVKFLTLWEYEASQSYEGERDSDWQMLGVIDTDRLRLTIQPQD